MKLAVPMSSLVAVVLVGLPLLSLLADLARRDLTRTLAEAQAALRRTEQP